MELDDYQNKAMNTCMLSCDNFAYMMLNLVGEVGEFSGKVAKAIRSEKMSIGAKPVKGERNEWQENQHFYKMSRRESLPFEDELMKEAGDILWQLAGLCTVMGWSLEDVAQQNLDKLASRQERGKIDGEGDNR